MHQTRFELQSVPGSWAFRSLALAVFIISLSSCIARAGDAGARTMIEPVYARCGQIKDASIDSGVFYDLPIFSTDSSLVIMTNSYYEAPGWKYRPGVWDCRTGTLIGVMDRREMVLHQAFVGGDTVVTTDGRDMIIWDARTAHIKSRTTVNGEIRGFAMNPQGNMFAFTAAGPADHVILWKPEATQAAARLKHNSATAICGFDATGTKLATTDSCICDDEDLEIWDRGGSLIHVWDCTTFREVFPPITSTYNPRALVPAAAFDPTGKRLVVAQRFGISVFDASTGKKLGETRWPNGVKTNDISISSFSPDGRWIAVPTTRPADLKDLKHPTLDEFGPLQICDVSSGALVRSIGSEMDYPSAFTSRGETVLCRTAEGTTELVDIGSGRILQTIGRTWGRLSISHDDQTIAVNDGKSIALFELQKRPTTKPDQTTETFHRTAQELIQGTGLIESRHSQPGVMLADGFLQNIDVSIAIFGHAEAPTQIVVLCNAPLEKSRKGYVILLKVVQNAFPEWRDSEAFFQANADLVYRRKVESVVANVKGGDVEMRWIDETAHFQIIIAPRAATKSPAK